MISMSSSFNQKLDEKNLLFVHPVHLPPLFLSFCFLPCDILDILLAFSLPTFNRPCIQIQSYASDKCSEVSAASLKQRLKVLKNGVGGSYSPRIECLI